MSGESIERSPPVRSAGKLLTLTLRLFLLARGADFIAVLGSWMETKGVAVPIAVVSVGVAMPLEMDDVVSSENGGGASETGSVSGTASVSAGIGADGRFFSASIFGDGAFPGIAR